MIEKSPATDYLSIARAEIDAVDHEMRRLFVRRMNAIRAVAVAKKLSGEPTDVPARESEILEKTLEEVPANLSAEAEALFHALFGISKKYQIDHPFDILKTRILLCGIKSCGKSTTAGLLSDLLQVPCFDTDELLAEKIGCSVRDFYAENGEMAFRAKEAEVLRSLDDNLPEACVVSLGGGAISNPFFPPYLLHHTGHLVWLNLPTEVAFARMESAGLPPFLALSPEPFRAYQTMCSERVRFFRAAAESSVEIGADDTPFQIACAVLNSLPDKILCTEREAE